MSSKYKKAGIIILYALISTLLLCIYNCLVVNNGAINHSVLLGSLLSYKTIVLALVSGVFITMGFILGSDKIFRYRYYIASILFVICVILGITGSSIGMITQLFGAPDNDIILGVSRGIRSDEWATFTPMTWSQYYSDTPFSYFSSIVRASSTDVFIEYGQPIRSLLMIFRPFQIGYLFLPVANGMSFFWMGRLIALFMASFEFGRLITSDNRRLSFIYAVMVSFAPAVQWWFAINGFVEMLLFMQLSIVIMNIYLHTKSVTKKSLLAIVIAICAGGYVLSMYPAWMIPLAYTLLAMILWCFITNRKTFSFSKTDVLPIIIAVLILGLSAFYVYKNSGDTINIISSTVYPGKRANNGGGVLLRFFNSFSNIWYPITNGATYDNVCESAYFISIFPLGIILYLTYIIRAKKSDLLCNLIIVVSCFLGWYCFWGFPSALANISMLKSSFANRALVILGFNDLILTIRGMYLCEKYKLSYSWYSTAILTILSSAFTTYLAYSINKAYFSKTMIAIQFVLLALIIGSVLSGFTNDHLKKLSTLLITATLLISGLLVNPIRFGVDSVSNMPILLKIREIVEEDPEGIWIVESAGYPIINIPIMEGARTINSTNIYPDVDRWESIDDDEDDSDIYNRYAHIRMVIDNDPQDEFTLDNPDVFTVAVSDREIQALEVDYILSNRSLDNTTDYQLLYNEYGYYIYSAS